MTSSCLQFLFILATCRVCLSQTNCTTCEKNCTQPKESVELATELQYDNLNDTSERRALANSFDYIDHTHAQSWYAALHKCKQMGGILSSAKDYAALSKNLNKRKSYWTGITNLSEENRFYNFGTGKRVKHLRWDKGEPQMDNIELNCIYLRFSQKRLWLMALGDCRDDKQFICEKT